MINIEGVDLSGKIISELQNIQEPDIARMTLENIDTVLDYVLDPAPSVCDFDRLDMVTTLHNLSKLIKILSRKEVSYEEKE